MALMAVIFTAFALAVPAAYAAVNGPAEPAAANQVLTWTAGDDYTKYTSAPATAVAGKTTIVFESSAATGNTTGLTHTLTFDSANGDYNNDVSLNILASPFDADGGRHTAEVTLTPGVYRYFCAMPGHQMMAGELVVTAAPGEDTTAPEASASLAGTKNSAGEYVSSATVTVTATDTESGLATIEYALDGAAYKPYTTPVAVNSAGQHTLSYRATDKAGNTSTAKSVTFTVAAPEPPKDTTAPDTSATVTGTKNSAGEYVSSATVTVTASDTESGIDTIEYALDGTAYKPYTAPVTVNTAGQHTLSYRATDKAGNTSTAKSVTFTVVAAPPKDTTAPDTSATVTGTKNSAGEYVSSATVTVTASDTESGIDTIEYALDGTAYKPYTTPVTVNTAGQHTLTYRATDKAGNTSTAKSVTFTVVAAPPKDTTAPDTSATVTGTKNSAGEYVSSATVTVTASDTESGIDTIEYALDGTAYKPYTAPVTVNTAGQHTLSYRATDKAGNTSTAKSVTFTVVAAPPKDETAPAVSASVAGAKNDAGEYVDTATVTLSATDTESGVATIEYALDGTAYKPYTTPVTVNTAGQHTLTYRATDKAGNTSTAKSVTFTVVAAPPKDTTAPDTSATVTGTKNSAGEYVSSATVTVTASDTESGIDTIEYALDGTAYKPYTAPVTVNTAGQHTLAFRATDRAGNTSAAQSVKFTVVAAPPEDRTAPEVSASVSGTKDDAGAYVGSATVTVTASDTESGVAGIEYSLDGGPYLGYSGPVAITKSGSHTVLYRASDKAGNTSTPQSLSLTVVDGRPPAGCAETDDRPTVFTGLVNTGVPNRVTTNGCTINELIADHRAWKSHGTFVSHVGDIVNALRKQGVVDQREAAAIKKAAAQSDVGMRDRGPDGR